MRALSRPEVPDWYVEFRKTAEPELEGMMAEVGSRGVPSSYLGEMRLYQNRSVQHRIRDAFFQAGSGTCHICEEKLDRQTTNLDHYRPRQFAGNERKDQSHPRHYWWLIYDWSNFQILCPVCNRFKGSLFPIAHRRAEEGAIGPDLDSERPLLLNPFDHDPKEHIKVGRSGEFSALTRQGEVTIEVYQLNRSELVRRRRTLWIEALDWVKANGWQRVADEATKNNIIGNAISALLPIPPGLVELFIDEIVKVGSRRKLLEKGPPNDGAPPLSADPPQTPEEFETRWISRVRMKNFCLFADLEINFPTQQAEHEPWLGIVGENGVGKSTFLKAIALTLVDEAEAQALVPDASEVFNRNTSGRNGMVELELSDGTSRRLSFGRRSKYFEFDGPKSRFPVIAFGASRILGRKDSMYDLPTAGAVNNLFDPVLPLVDAEAWLCDTELVSSQDFAVLTDNLKYLMGLPLSTEVTRRQGKIHFRRGESRHSLSQMSDGFRSVIGLTVHIMKHLAAETPVMSEAEGTVLLDEIELHLHPRWKIQIVGKLRELFPRVRFVITTHDPLCLRGLERNESHLFRLNEDGDNVVAETLDIRPGLDVDDLLTGGWFGLGTTYDRETEDMINALSALSLKENSFRVRGEEMPAADADRMRLMREELRSRLPGFAGSEAEVDTLSDVVRGKVTIAETDEIDAENLQARLRAAFD